MVLEIHFYQVLKELLLIASEVQIPALRIIKPKEYRAKLSYLPHPVDPASGRPVPGETLPEVRLPPLSSPVPDSWTTIEDEFRIAYALNLSHLDPTTMFAPHRDGDRSQIKSV